MSNTLGLTHRSRGVGIAALSAVIVAGAATSSHAAIVQSVSGISSAGVAFAFEAHFSISGDTLTLTLFNNSPVGSRNPNDLLSSFYFDIVSGANTRPTLAYASAAGDVWQTDRDNPDILVAPAANLRALAAGDNTWQFKTFNPAQAPFNGFGVGTVGNSQLNPNGFNGNITGGINYSIYCGDVSTSNLNGQNLVRDSATFVFTGVSGFTESDIRGASAFGLGTAPDSLAYVPTPGAAAMLVPGAAMLLRRKRR